MGIIDHNDNNDDDLCCICYENEKMKGFKCLECNGKICVSCFKKINISTWSNNKYEEHYYRCPFCNLENIYKYSDFDDNIELVNVVRHDLKTIYNNYIVNPDTTLGVINTKLSDTIELNEKINKQNEELMRENEKMKKIINILNDCINNNVKSIKQLYMNTKTKRIDKNKLIPYFNIIDISFD